MRIRVASRLWWASRKVVSVTGTSVRARSCRANSAGPDPHEQVARARGQRGVAVDGRQLGARLEEGRGGAVRLVDGDVGEVGEQLGAAVAAHPGLEQLGALVDEAGRGPPALEHRVGEHRLEERDVGARRRGSGTPPGPVVPGAPPSGRCARGR